MSNFLARLVARTLDQKTLLRPRVFPELEARPAAPPSAGSEATAANEQIPTGDASSRLPMATRLSTSERSEPKPLPTSSPAPPSQERSDFSGANSSPIMPGPARSTPLDIITVEHSEAGPEVPPEPEVSAVSINPKLYSLQKFLQQRSRSRL